VQRRLVICGRSAIWAGEMGAREGAARGARALGGGARQGRGSAVLSTRGRALGTGAAPGRGEVTDSRAACARRRCRAAWVFSAGAPSGRRARGSSPFPRAFAARKALSLPAGVGRPPVAGQSIRLSAAASPSHTAWTARHAVRTAALSTVRPAIL
jgi:hypothetical protein